MRIYVFGANGMIGRYVNKYLKGSIAVTRHQVDALIIRMDLFQRQLDQLDIHEGDVVINAMGITNKRTREGWEFLVVNSLFPRLLADYCEFIGAHMIHISTDCVYNGETGMYDELCAHDDESIYGITKSCGEPHNCIVIRTSLIGETPNGSTDLLEWVRGHKNEKIHGYIDHIWNGITCLQFAKICEQMINEREFWQGDRHIYSPRAVTKAELVTMINEIYGLGNEVVLTNSERAINRTMTSLYEISRFNIPDIREQIIEQKNFRL